MTCFHNGAGGSGNASDPMLSPSNVMKSVKIQIYLISDIIIRIKIFIIHYNLNTGRVGFQEMKNILLNFVFQIGDKTSTHK